MTPEEYARMHQQAFRCAFNFLNQHFPPGDSDEWWLKAAKDCSADSVSCGETPLAIELLNAVMNYLGQEYKRRYQDAEN